jgi:hypothetical protein
MNMTIKNVIGDIGETLVQEFHGPNFILSDDRFDAEKDGTFGSLTAEIKTMTKIRKGNEYWLELNQYDKVTSVDLLFIVDIPLFAKDGCKIYLCPNNANLQVGNRMKNNNISKMIIIPENKLYLLTTIPNDDRIEQLVEFSDDLSPFRKAIKENMYA